MQSQLLKGLKQQAPQQLQHQRQQVDSLLVALRTWRQSRARQAGKQPSNVLPDQVLQALAQQRPQTFLELQKVRKVADWACHGRCLADALAARRLFARSAAPEAVIPCIYRFLCCCRCLVCPQLRPSAWARSCWTS